MRVVCRPVWAASVLITLLAPAPRAAAGPIEWEFGGQLARTGDATGPAVSGLSGDYIGGSSTIHETTFSRLAGASGHGWGWQSVRVGSVTPDGPREDPNNWAAQTFGIQLALTDLASGQSGTLTFAAAGGETLVQDLDRPWLFLSRTSFASITGGAEQTVTLGGNTYDVSLRVVSRNDGADIMAEVRVGDVAATPEPGTLALAGLGLGAVPFARRGPWRRRR